MAKAKPPRGPQLELAGDLCVAFVNTAAARTNNRQQGVQSYSELMTWGQQVGLVSPTEAGLMAQRAKSEPEAAQAVFTQTAEMRLTLSRIFLATGRGREPSANDLERLNTALAAALPAMQLVPGKNGLTWGWAGEESALDRMVWPVLRSAAELLISLQGRPHVRQCAAKECRLFFVDRSPSGQRVWCERRTCGNRDKALRHYHRLGKRSRISYRR